MVMELFILYLWLKLDTLITSLTVLLVLTGVFGIIGWLWATAPYYSSDIQLRVAY